MSAQSGDTATATAAVAGGHVRPAAHTAAPICPPVTHTLCCAALVAPSSPPLPSAFGACTTCDRSSTGGSTSKSKHREKEREKEQRKDREDKVKERDRDRDRDRDRERDRDRDTDRDRDREKRSRGDTKEEHERDHKRR